HHVYELMDLIDVVEVCNAQNLLGRPNRRAAKFAERYDFPAIVGSDTHHRGYLDTCYQWMPPFDGPRGFLQSLREAELVPGRHPLRYFVRSARVALSERTPLPVPVGTGRNCITVRTRHTWGLRSAPST